MMSEYGVQGVNGYVFTSNNASEEKLKERIPEHETAKKANKVTIKLVRGGVSQNFVRDHLKKDIDSGLVHDNNSDGLVNVFSNKDKRNLEKEITNIFTSHGYSTNFTQMKGYRPDKSTNGDGMYEITYAEYERLVQAAGYDFQAKAKGDAETPTDKVSIPAQNDLPQRGQVPSVTAEVEKKKSAETQFEEKFSADQELNGKSSEEMERIVNQRINNIEKQLVDLQSPKYEVKRTGALKFIGLGKKKQFKVEETPEEITQKKQQIEELNQRLDESKRDLTYLNALNNKYWIYKYASMKNTDADGNVIRYPSYNQTKYKTQDGQVHKVLRVSTYNPETTSYDHKYYGLDVQKVNGGFVGREDWVIVPDMDNEITGGCETK